MTRSAAVIRRALVSDGADLARLSTQLGYPMSPEEAQVRFREIDENSDQVIFVAESGRRAIAWIQVEVSRVFESRRQAEIAGLVVDEAFRSGGLGGRLVAEAERWARERGCHVVRVRSNVIRERAHAFYRRAGYGEIKTQRVFEKRL
ncbi:MAG TPA: GNAT family N-acetyltransferase [Thermoanaerobaculia bacterium]|jgi:GNAT superfamily N-acetyltransferase